MAKKVYPIRLEGELKQKLEVVARHERRKPSDWVRILVEDAVAAYEAKHGPILLPPAPAPPEPR